MGKYSFSDEQEKRREDRRPKPKPRKPILRKKPDATVSSKVRGLINTDQNKLLKNKAAEDFAALQRYFAEAAKIISMNPYCMECGAFIPEAYYRAASAHVLPKRKEYGFPSVCTMIENLLVLGAGCGCHDKYDRTWEDAATMKVFPKAIEIFKFLYPFIHPSERKNIPEVLRQEILNLQDNGKKNNEASDSKTDQG